MSYLKVIVGTGWWSDVRPHDWTIGSQDTHTGEFFAVWLRLVRKYIDPWRVVVTDSSSPLKPAPEVRRGVEWIELDRNYGHANDIRVGEIQTKYSGFMRSVFVGATYALACDADIYVYLEQDCVIHGDGFMEAIVGGLEHPIGLGARTVGGVGINGPAAPMLQQSLMVVKRSALERFIASILLAPESDGELSPELKFERDLRPFSILSVPFGRSRPLDLTVPHFYAQHLNREELDAVLRLEGVAPDPQRGTEGAAKGDDQWIEAACIERPVAREIVAVWRRRADLQRTYAKLDERTLEELTKWALLAGVHEDPVLGELSSEIAELAAAIQHGLPRVEPAAMPSRVHVVTMAAFHDSFCRCAESLFRGLRRNGVPVRYHAAVEVGCLADLVRSTPPDEVVHVVGQGPVSELFSLSVRNWLLTIHGAAPYAVSSELHPPPGADLEALRAGAGRLQEVVCPSFAARREISIAYSIPLSRLHPVPHFFDFDVFAPEGDRHTCGCPYFIAVANYQPVKNFERLLEGYALFVQQNGADTALLIVGGHNAHLARLQVELRQRWPAVADRVHFVGQAGGTEQPDLAALYRGAVALVSTSHHESFGMPSIEAALCRTPVIGPKRSMRVAAWSAQATIEVLGHAGLYVDPDRPQDVASSMALLASDANIRAAVATRCFERASFYIDPVFLCRRYLHVYQRVLGHA